MEGGLVSHCTSMCVLRHSYGWYGVCMDRGGVESVRDNAMGVSRMSGDARAHPKCEIIH